jgi:hypothetical protein
MWWKVVPFFTAYAWAMTALMVFLVGLAIRDGRADWVVGASVAGVGILVFTHWHRGRVARAKQHFAKLVADYEKAFAQSA